MTRGPRQNAYKMIEKWVHCMGLVSLALLLVIFVMSRFSEETGVFVNTGGCVPLGAAAVSLCVSQVTYRFF